MDLAFDKPGIKEYLEGFALVDRQAGAVFLVNGKVVGMDAFGKSATFSREFKNLLESYVLDAVSRFQNKTDAGGGKKQASDMMAAAIVGETLDSTSKKEIVSV